MKDFAGLVPFILNILIGVVVAIIQLYVSSKMAKLEERLKRYCDEEIEKAINRVNIEWENRVQLMIKLAKEEVKNDMRK